MDVQPHEEATQKSAKQNGSGQKSEAKPAETMREAFDRLYERTRYHAAPSYDERISRLDRLEAAILANKDAIVTAICDDFGNRSRHESLVAEIFVSLGSLRYVRDHLRGWMSPQPREVAWTFLPGRAEVLLQPLGVVGIIAPWNYPANLVFSPLVFAIAAGNRVMIKPSEHTPKMAELLAKILSDAFSDDEVVTILGDAKVSADFSALPFDHLVFTGSTAVGKLVMRAAAENLTPVTLELGGKSPAIVGTDAPLDETAMRVMMGKLFNAGQTCIAPDYVLVPKGSVDAFVDGCKKAVEKMFPKLVKNDDYTSIINAHHFKRLERYLDEAKQKKSRLVELNPAGESTDAERRRMIPVLVVNPDLDLTLMHDEIFGPILPVVAYESLEDAIKFINDRPRPLALYYFGHRNVDVDRVLERTTSGGASINETMVQFAQDDMPFGGVGPSGMGHYHGHEGFEMFSKKKSVFYQSRLNATSLLRPPYGRTIEMLLRVLIGR